MKLFKKREAFEIADNVKKLNKNKKNDFKMSQFKFYDAYGVNVDSKDVMQKWVERRLTVRAENQLITREYMKGRFWHDFLMICIAALLVTIGFDYFISATGASGLVPFGIGSFARFFAVLQFPNNVSKASSFYFIYFFIINIPLMVFGFFKVGAKFTLLTLVYLALQIAFDQIVQAIPIINPESWTMVIDTQLMGTIPTAWNGAVWIFIKAIIGGLIAGWGYAIAYKAGASSAGADFITMYVSIRMDKSIAIVNRIVYYFILFLVIILNTVILSPSAFNPDIKYGELYQTTNIETWTNMLTYLHNNPGQFSREVINAFGSSNNKIDLGTINKIISVSKGANIDPFNLSGKLGHNNSKAITQWNYKEFTQEMARSGFKGFAQSQINMMRFLFIFGPTLFASYLLVQVSTATTDFVYPTHKVKTYLIATNKAPEMKKALVSLGYRNSFIQWEANNEVQGKVLDRDVVMVTMTVTNWREVEPSILEVDPVMTVNILKTDRVKGQFDYHIRTDRKNEEANKILRKDKEWLKEIHEESLKKTDKQYARYMAKRNRIENKYSFNVSEAIDNKRELDQWYKAQVAKIKKTKQRALLKLEHDWLLDWAESQKQYDYIKREYTKKLKELGQTDKKRLHAVRKEYETKTKMLKNR